MLKREDIVERMAAKGFTKKDARLAIDLVFDTITELMVEGEEVMIHGFGIFGVKNVVSHESIDCRTGERITIPAHNAPKFKPGVALKRYVLEGIIRE